MGSTASAGHFHDWAEQATVFDAIAAGLAATYTLDGTEPERVNAMQVTPGYFAVAYVAPVAGRYFTVEDLNEARRVVVLSHGLWQRRFGSDANIINREVRLNGEPHTIVGVAPPSYALTDPARAAVVGGFSAQAWTPLLFSPQQRSNYGNHRLGVIAKLKPKITLAMAQRDLERVTRGIAERQPQAMESRGVRALSLSDTLVSDITTQLWVLSTSAIFVLLIGCANVAGVLLARATSRRREMAIRASLGGGQPRIVRQVLTESMVMALAGGVAAIAVGYASIDFFVDSGPATVPRLRDAGLQPVVLLFAFATTVIVGIAFGLAPAIRAGRADLSASLRDTGSGFFNQPQRDRTRSLVVVGQVAIAVILLVGTGLSMRSAQKLSDVPLGFVARDVLTARVALPAARYGDGPMVTDAYRRILAELRQAGGVRHAGASTNIPLVGGSTDASVSVEGFVFPRGSEPSPQIRLVTDDYFEAIGMTIVRGRSLQASDMAGGASPVVVINQRLASVLWPDQDPLGERVSTWTRGSDPEWREVVGVVADARTFGQRADVPLELFMPYSHAPEGAWNVFQRSMVLVVRTGEDWPEVYVPQVRRAVSAMDPSLPVYDVRTMETIVVNSTANRRFYLWLTLLLAVTGLGLAMLGIYGVITYFVTARAPEIGLRMAIGAGRREVLRLVIGQGLRMAVLGVVVGLAAAALLARMMTALLYAVEPGDSVTFAGVAALVVVVSLLASLVPSLRAARIDPLVAIRCE